MKNLIYQDDYRFENITFNALFVADLKNFYTEYIDIMSKYKELSLEVKKIL